MLHRLHTLTLLILAGAIALVPGGDADAQSTSDPYRVISGTGLGGGCAGAGFDVSEATPVQATTGVVGCFSGSAEVTASAGAGTLHAASEVHHTGFGTATGLG
ncbi:MAG TPA: hypothetical protein VH436_19795, partial [Vicinamibacterales bacterium]